MSEFRIGRKFARHFYPDPPRGNGAPVTPLARNFAYGTSQQVPVPTSDINIDWFSVENTGSSSTDIEITPLSTGIIVVSGVLVIKNGAEIPVDFFPTLSINGVHQALSRVRVPGNGHSAVPILRKGFVPVSVTQVVQVLIHASTDTALTIGIQSSTLSVREVTAASG